MSNNWMKILILLMNFILILNDEDLELSSRSKSSSIDTKNQIDCTPINCRFNQGMCVMNKCECFYGFVTMNKFKSFAGSELTNLSRVSKTHNTAIASEIDFCTYKQHCKITAFFLEFFFPIGAGHFYVGKYHLALFKLAMFLVFFCFICGEFFFIRCKLSALNKCHLYLALGIVADIFLWLCFHLFDLVNYGFGFYQDGNGIALI
jgi:hypothetical protein